MRFRDMPLEERKELVDAVATEVEREMMRTRRTIIMSLAGLVVTLLFAFTGVVWNAGHVDQNVRDLTSAASDLHRATQMLTETVRVLEARVASDGRQIERLQDRIDLEGAKKD